MGKYDKKKNPSHTGAKSAPRGAKYDADVSSNPEFRKIAFWLAGVKFRKKLFGGLDPNDVWKKIEELNALYEKALMAERVRCDLLMEQMSRDAALNSILNAPDPEEDGDG